MSLLETKISKPLKAFSGKTPEQITAEEVAAVNAVLAEENITSVSLIVSGSTKKLNKEIESLTEKLTAAEKDRDEWKEKANRVPAAGPKEPVVTTKKEGEPEADANQFETSVDRELKAYLN